MILVTNRLTSNSISMVHGCRWGEQLCLGSSLCQLSYFSSFDVGFHAPARWLRLFETGTVTAHSNSPENMKNWSTKFEKLMP